MCTLKEGSRDKVNGCIVQKCVCVCVLMGCSSHVLINRMGPPLCAERDSVCSDSCLATWRHKFAARRWNESGYGFVCVCIRGSVCVHQCIMGSVFVPVHKKAKHNATSFSYTVKSDACKHKTCKRMRRALHPHFKK